MNMTRDVTNNALACPIQFAIIRGAGRFSIIIMTSCAASTIIICYIQLHTYMHACIYMVIHA